MIYWIYRKETRKILARYKKRSVIEVGTKDELFGEGIRINVAKTKIM